MRIRRNPSSERWWEETEAEVQIPPGWESGGWEFKDWRGHKVRLAYKRLHLKLYVVHEKELRGREQYIESTLQKPVRVYREYDRRFSQWFWVYYGRRDSSRPTHLMKVVVRLAQPRVIITAHPVSTIDSTGVLIWQDNS